MPFRAMQVGWRRCFHNGLEKLLELSIAGNRCVEGRQAEVLTRFSYLFPLGKLRGEIHDDLDIGGQLSGQRSPAYVEARHNLVVAVFPSNDSRQMPDGSSVKKVGKESQERQRRDRTVGTFSENASPQTQIG